jgi:putative endopeptidase
MLTGIAVGQEPTLPYTPSLDLASMDKQADPCVNFYEYSCGGWKKNNPIPPDQTSWSVYAKLYQDNLQFLRGILEQASQTSGQRDEVTRQIGDFYAACMDEAEVEKQGLTPIRDYLDAVGNLKSTKELAPLVAKLQMVYGRSVLFLGGSTQDPDDAEKIIAELDLADLGCRTATTTRRRMTSPRKRASAT